MNTAIKKLPPPGPLRLALELRAPMEAAATLALWPWMRLGRPRAFAPELMARLNEPVPVPSTSIYSRSDGSVDWRVSQQAAGPMAQNIRVPASHTGMGANPLVLRLLAERLAQPEDDRQPRKGSLVCKVS